MLHTLARRAAPAMLTLSLLGCGGGGSDAPPVSGPLPATPTVALTLSAATLSLTAGTSTVVTADIVRGGGFADAVTVTGTGVPTGVTVSTETIAAGVTSATVNITAAANAAAGVTNLSFAGTATGVTIAPAALALTVTAAPAAGPIARIGAAFTHEASGDDFGRSVALSADGMRVIFGAPLNDGSGADAGHARVYQRSGSTWTQLGADIDGEDAGEHSGHSVAMSANGSRVAVGAYLNDDGGTNRGQVRVLDLVGGAWAQVGTDIQPPVGTAAGSAVALSASGHRVVIGAPGRGSTVGYAFVYELVSGSWTQVGLTLSAAGSYELGAAVDISDDGNRVAVGVPGSYSADRPGYTVVYEWSAGAWTQLGGSIAGEANGDNAGSAVSLSSDGSRIAIGAPGNRTDGSTSGGGGVGGHVRVYQLVGTTWTQMGADIDGSVALNGDAFGSTVALSGDGTRLISSAPNNSIARIYTFAAGAWTQTGSNVTDGSRPNGVAISADGLTAAVGYVNSGTAQVYSVAP